MLGVAARGDQRLSKGGVRFARDVQQNRSAFFVLGTATKGSQSPVTNIALVQWFDARTVPGIIN